MVLDGIQVTKEKQTAAEDAYLSHVRRVFQFDDLMVTISSYTMVKSLNDSLQEIEESHQMTLQSIENQHKVEPFYIIQYSLSIIIIHHNIVKRELFASVGKRNGCSNEVR